MAQWGVAQASGTGEWHSHLRQFDCRSPLRAAARSRETSPIAPVQIFRRTTTTTIESSPPPPPLPEGFPGPIADLLNDIKRYEASHNQLWPRA